MLRNSTTSWGSVSRWLHWGLAVVIIGMLCFGVWMNHFVPRPDRLFYRTLHADVGYVVLALTLLRLLWRAVNPIPALPATMPGWQRFTAHVTHIGLYLLVIAVALLGWAHSGAHTPNYADWFGLFKVPQFTSPDKVLADQLEGLHIYAAYLLGALIAFHLLAAYYHKLFKHDAVMERMLGGDAS
jgi:cytochrome b561